MLNQRIYFNNFNFKNVNNKKKIFKFLKNLKKSPNEVLQSLSSNYKDSYSKKIITELKKFKNFRVIGMGGSILGTKAIYNFLEPKFKNFEFIDNLSGNTHNKKNTLNLIISKSGNTLETLSNVSVLIKKKEKNVLISENKMSYLTELANRLKAEIISHNNYIGGRYSVLSEVGMLPAQLMGFKPVKFRRLNSLIKNKRFINSLVSNVSNIINLSKKRTNSVILNYDCKSKEFFNWYQQLVAESLGKKGKGIHPIVSKMPEDNHSLMQYYLDGNKNNFFTLFFFKEKNSKKINKNMILKSHSFIKNKKLNDILFSQFSATEKVFRKKNIPFRSFIIFNRNEETLGELFTFFILETILLGMAMGVNPYDQPAVELIKKETKKILI